MCLTFCRSYSVAFLVFDKGIGPSSLMNVDTLYMSIISVVALLAVSISIRPLCRSITNLIEYGMR